MSIQGLRFQGWEGRRSLRPRCVKTPANPTVQAPQASWPSPTNRRKDQGEGGALPAGGQVEINQPRAGAILLDQGGDCTPRDHVWR